MPSKAYCAPVAIAHLPKETEIEILIRQNLMATSDNPHDNEELLGKGTNEKRVS